MTVDLNSCYSEHSLMSNMLHNTADSRIIFKPPFCAQLNKVADSPGQVFIGQNFDYLEDVVSLVSCRVNK